MCIVVEVTHFGAVGDGQTDDAAAFQAAVDYLKDAQSRSDLPTESLNENG